MELEGEQLEHMAKNRKCLQAVKGEVAAHTVTRLQPGQPGCAFGSVGRGQALLSDPLCCTDLHPTAQQFPHGGGTWRQKPMEKYKSQWRREEVQVSVSLCHKVEQSCPDEKVILPTPEIQKQRPS